MMLVVASTYGQSLIFTDKKSLATVVEHLSGQLEWIEAEGIEPPYVYHQAENGISFKELDEWTDQLKDSMKGLGRERSEDQ